MVIHEIDQVHVAVAVHGRHWPLDIATDDATNPVDQRVLARVLLELSILRRLALPAIDPNSVGQLHGASSSRPYRT